MALEIAESVKAALLEGDFAGAVNAPLVGGDRLKRLRPLLDLSTRLGRLAAALAEGPVSAVEVRFAGEGDDLLRPLTAGAVIGLLEGAIGSPAVNVVNALHLARQRGIQVERTRVDAALDYANLIELKVHAGAATTRVAGALLGEGHPRVVSIEHFQVDVVPRGMLVVLRNRDVPGVIGRVGTLLGNAGINIAGYHQARVAAGGDALAAIGVDARLPGPVLDSLRALPEIRSAAMVDLGE